MKTLEIDQLRPTQMTHGTRDIQKKTMRHSKLACHDLEMAITEKPILVVCGPGEAPYTIDHRHVATARRQTGIKSVPFVLVSDLSSLSWADFWLTLENNRWTYPYAPHGQRVTFKEMRKPVWKLANEEFRSLAAPVSDAGGYRPSNRTLHDLLAGLGSAA